MLATAIEQSAVDLIGLATVMARTEGSADVRIGLVDGPVASSHPDLVDANIIAVENGSWVCLGSEGSACSHGTFMAGILAARRGSSAPSICPGCTLLVRPIFADRAVDETVLATPREVAQAIVDCVDAGAQIVNLSAAAGQPTIRRELALRQALDYAAGRGTLVVAAAGNQATLGSSEITRHAGVIPVVSYDRNGRPTGESNFGKSIGRGGIGAPGEAVSLDGDGASISRQGTSVAAAFVTGAIALLWSLFPTAPASTMQRAVVSLAPRRSVIPPLLNAESAHQLLIGGSR